MIETIEITAAQKKAQRARSLALGLALAAFVVIVYVATWAKLGSTILDRSM